MAKTLTMTIREYFGMNAAAAVTEIKKLDQKDKDQFRQMFTDAGVEVEPEAKK